MNTLKNEIVEQFRAIMDEEQSLVVDAVNGSNSFRAIRTSRTRNQLIDEMTGRQDPEQFTIRAVADETGAIRPGRTITVAGEEVNVINANPDAVGAIIEIAVQKRRTA